MRRTLLVVSTVLMQGCLQPVSLGYNDAGQMQPPPADRLTLKGKVCTAPADPAAASTKVVVVLDQSGSMCVTDPPGSQVSGTFCGAFAATLSPPPPPKPSRVRALEQLFSQFSQRPDVSLAVVPFETHVSGHWPTMGGFASLSVPINYADVIMRLDAVQSSLGKGTDYQGALEYARQLVADDITRLENQSPELLPRTRYVVLFVTDGVPFPRCAVDDNLATYADPAHPDLIWADSAGAASYCNTIDPNDPEAIPGLIAGGARNQNDQLFSDIDQLVDLGRAHNVADIRFHTVLLFNEQNVTACGPICQDLYGSYPSTPPAQYASAARSVAEWLLQHLAQHGSGTFTEFNNNAGLATLTFTQDFSALGVGKNIEKSLIIRPFSSVPGAVDRERDTDGDSLPDSAETSTSPLLADTDGDCFDDGFEVRHATDGFDPMVKDVRGCDPMASATLGCMCRDVDGDGLSQFAELYLGTRATVVDSDGDGISDGVEVRWGLDPLRPLSPGQDSDSDSVTDAEEIRIGSDPLHADSVFRASSAMQYASTSTDNPDGTVCYDFTVDNIPRVDGVNLFHLDFAEVPQNAIATDYGVWKRACAWASFSAAGGSVASVSLVDHDFKQPALMTGDPMTYKTLCIGTPP